MPTREPIESHPCSLWCSDRSWGRSAISGATAAALKRPMRCTVLLKVAEELESRGAIYRDVVTDLLCQRTTEAPESTHWRCKEHSPGRLQGRVRPAVPNIAPKYVDNYVPQWPETRMGLPGHLHKHKRAIRWSEKALWLTLYKRALTRKEP
jgi:hypothetical protein